MQCATKIAKHFVDKANIAGHNDMTSLKLLKIVYIAHGWMLGLHDKPLISEDVEAWKYGPVIPELYRDTRNFRREHITEMSSEYHVDLNSNEQSIINQTFDGYAGYTANQLIRLTHKKGTPWYQVTKGKHARPGLVIENSIIANYYYQLAISDG